MPTSSPNRQTDSLTLAQRLPAGARDNDAILDAFLEHLTARGTSLYAAQETAILELFDEKNVILNTPTGSGKSTTLAALINHINNRDHAHIITIEDPIEFVHTRKSSLISQREVGLHT